MSPLTLVVSILVFGLLILAHEFGHFIAAKKAGIRVVEFAIGFGPRVGGWRRGDTVYSLRLFPVGGFTLLAGMDPDEEPSEDGFASKSVGRRAAVLAAGPFMNFALTMTLFSLMFAAFGLPVGTDTDSTVIGQVIPGFPAEKAGLEPGDVILAIDGREVGTWAEIVEHIDSSAGREMVVLLRRGDRTLTLEVTPTADPESPEEGFLGIAPVLVYRRVGPLEALYMGVTETWRVLVGWLSGLVGLLLGRAPLDVAGPVMTVKFIGTTAKSGFANLMYLAGFLSLNIGLFNLLPFPALDGGRLSFLAYEGVTGRRVDPRKESLVHFLGFATLILLIILVTYRDVARL